MNLELIPSEDCIDKPIELIPPEDRLNHKHRKSVPLGIWKTTRQKLDNLPKIPILSKSNSEYIKAKVLIPIVKDFAFDRLNSERLRKTYSPDKIRKVKLITILDSNFIF